MMRQILAVMGLGARSLPQRLRSSLMIVVALVSVTVPPLAIFALGASLKNSYLETGAPDRVMILAQGALLQTGSELSLSWSSQIAAAPGIKQWRGQPLMDMEISAGLHRSKRTRPEKGYTKVRGFGPLGFVMRPELKLVTGRLPRPGSHEVIVGLQAWRKFTGLEIGREVEIAKTNWRVVGIFRGGGNLDGDLIADAGLLKAALHRETYDIALLSLTSPDDLPRIKEALHSLPVTVLREQDYYARMWRSVPNNALYVTVVLLVIIGGGALAATTHGV
jgi:putative ABC transport system permease protein